MADLNQIVETHKDKLGDFDHEGFSKLGARLGELGYDVLINDKKAAEFVPSGRLSEVVAQRDTYKGQSETMQKQLAEAMKAADGNAALQGKIQELMDQNSKLIADMENTKVETAFIMAAGNAGAIDPKDLLVFIDRESLKTNSKGELLGVDAEITRLKTAKPYLFKSDAPPPTKRGGSDGAGAGAGQKFNINAVIRSAAGRK